MRPAKRVSSTPTLLVPHTQVTDSRVYRILHPPSPTSLRRLLIRSLRRLVGGGGGDGLSRKVQFRASSAVDEAGGGIASDGLSRY